MSKQTKLLLTLLVLITAAVWIAVLTVPEENFQMIACDVGQGDGFLLTHKNTQVVIDGGQGKKMVDCLDRYLPFWDREIELVVISHPQTDHFGGLIDVFRNFQVRHLLVSGLDSSSQEYELLKSAVGGDQTKVLKAVGGQTIRLGLIYLEVVFPTEGFITANSDNTSEVFKGFTSEANDVLGTYTSSKDPNDFSVVLNVSFGDMDILFTGDIGPKVIDDVIGTGKIHDIEVLKVPHHGSKNGLTKELLDMSSPEIAVISVGKNNRYNHPHNEVVELLVTSDIEILRTDKEGDVIIESDGTELWVSK